MLRQLRRRCRLLHTGPARNSRVHGALNVRDGRFMHISAYAGARACGQAYLHSLDAKCVPFRFPHVLSTPFDRLLSLVKCVCER